MSAFVCNNNRTFSCIIELAMKSETITNPDLLAQRLYLLNVESVNQRYELKKSNPGEYQGYMTAMAGVKFEPHPELCDIQRIKAARCWMYQSCEGDCCDDPLFKAVDKIVEDVAVKTAKELSGEDYSDPRQALSFLDKYADEHEINTAEMWE